MASRRLVAFDGSLGHQSVVNLRRCHRPLCCRPARAVTTSGRLADRLTGTLGRPREAVAQHSMTLIAKPPREVSLYLRFMSSPV